MKHSLYLLITSVLFACTSDSNFTKTQLNLVFQHKVNNQNFQLANSYTNASNETYQVNELKYIISNITLVKTSGEIISVPVEDSYFIINAEDENSLQINLPQIPIGNYRTLRFGFGVDQSNYPLNGVNDFIPQAEDLDMLWSWSAGYKFLKFEGNYSTSTKPSESFLFHVGSHGTNLDNYKLVSLDKAFSLGLKPEHQLSITADIAKLFDGFYQMSLEDKDDIQVDPINAPKIAENVQLMFSLE